MRNCKFAVYGEEFAKDGRPHFQVYAEWDENNKKSYQWVQRFLENAHCEKRRGNPKQAAGYCKKGTFEKPEGEFDYSVFFEEPHPTWKGEQSGDISQQGRRNDLKRIAEEIMAGSSSVDTIIQDDPMIYHQFGRTLEKVQAKANMNKKRKFKTEAVWLWGATGVGKTRRVYEEVGEEEDELYVHNTDDKGWWDGYSGQKYVLIDDFRGAITYSTLLKLCDRYPMTVPRRNLPPVPFMAEKIFITSSMPPHEVYYNLDQNDSLEQLKRRIEIVRMK